MALIQGPYELEYGFGAQYTILIIRNPPQKKKKHHSIGNYLGPYIIEPYYRSLIEPFKEAFKGTLLLAILKAPILPTYQLSC